MSLTSEWRSRIESWIKALEKLCYAPAGSVELEAAFTFEQLTPAEALDLDYAPIAPGTPWGKEWEYAWLRGRFEVPARRADQRLVLHAGHPTPQFGNDIFGEWRVFIDGTEMGSRDWAHTILWLGQSECSRSRTHNFLAEAFGGPTRVGAGGGPALDGCPSLPEITGPQRILPEVTFGLWREDAFQLALDARTLLELRDQLDPHGLRVSEIDEGLRDFTLIADPELPWDHMEPSLRAARERLKPLLDCRNGTTAPTLFCVGHSHLDVVYQWPLKETERKVARTFNNQLGLMGMYPEYRYMQSMPVLYEIARRLYPELYQRVKTAVRHGQWVAEGAMWTEADVNLPGGESLVRQCLYGCHFFEEEFGVKSEFLWLPDTFGFTGALPQIMAGCGITTFGSAKMFSRFSEGGEPFPYSTFYWEGIDGTRVLSHFVANYGITTNPQQIAEQWTQNPQKEGVRARMAIYGHSDGGGGCERSHLEYLRRQEDLEGLPRCRQSKPADFFAFQRTQPEKLPVYVGEIYMPAHRGVYTSQADLKKGNRRCEVMLRDAELWACAAHVLMGVEYPKEALEQAWKKTLFNQFHDILPGSCIERAVKEANGLYAEALSESWALAESAMRALATVSVPCVVDAVPASGGGSFHQPDLDKNLKGERGSGVVFNSLPWGRRELIELDESPLPPGVMRQDVGGKTYVEVTAPSCGWGPLYEACTSSDVPINEYGGDGLPAAGFVHANSAYDFENEAYRVRLDRVGRVTSWFDKVSQRELASAPLNDFCLYRDTPYLCDAWEIESHYASQPVELGDEAQVELVCSGPLAVVVRVRRRLHCSTLEQHIWLKRGSRRLEFHTWMSWAEKHKLLKVRFPFAVSSSEAMHEIQFGYLKRPTHRSRRIDQDRFEVCQQKWSALAEEGRGVAVLNDCKYGISAEESTLSLSLLRAPVAPDAHADIGEHSFAYALYAWNGSFVESRVQQEALEFNVPVQMVAGGGADVDDVGLDSPYQARSHEQGRAVSLFSCDAPTIILETVKLAEDGSGDVVLRLYESSRTATRCKLLTGFQTTKACETDMLENGINTLPLDDGVRLDFRPFEIKTVRLCWQP